MRVFSIVNASSWCSLSFMRYLGMCRHRWIWSIDMYEIVNKFYFGEFHLEEGRSLFFRI